ncbi:MAG: DUF6056 family protein [bacterium]|nr:DUF6056 family protein [bacterium]
MNAPPRKPNAVRHLSTAALVGFATVLWLAAYTGSFTRLMADDYCTQELGARAGIIGGLVEQYQGWAGQFSNILVKNAMGVLGADVVPFLPALILGAWFAVLWWTLAQIAQAVGLQTRFIPVLAAAFLFAIYAFNPQRIQSFFWLAAFVPYTMPLVLTTGLIGVIVRFTQQTEQPIPVGVAITALIAFVTSGFSETFVVTLVAALGVAFLWAASGLKATTRRRALTLIVTAGLAAVAAALIIVAAPGNQLRLDQFSSRPSLGQALSTALVSSIGFFAAALTQFAPFAVLPSVVIPAWVAYTHNTRWLTHRRPRILVLLLLSGLIIIAAPITVSSILIGTLPPARAYIIPLFFLQISVWLFGYGIGESLALDVSRKRLSRLTVEGAGVFAAVLVGASIVTAAYTTTVTFSLFRVFAAEWDARDQALRANAEAGETAMVVDAPQDALEPRIGLENLTNDPAFWVNSCMARYYGLESIRIRDG